MNHTIEELFRRKSVRVYEDKPIENEKTELILDSAIQAPTAGNMTLYSIIKITDNTIKEKLAVSCDNQPFIAKAPLILLFLADYQKWYDSFICARGSDKAKNIRKPAQGDLLLAVSDTLIAAQNAVVAAQSMGIGSCYIGDIIENYEYHKELFNLPKYVLPVCMLCLGYPTQQQIEREKPKRFPKEFVVFENSYKHLSDEELIKMHTMQSVLPDNFDFNKSITAKMNRKWNCKFSEEMSRSAKLMIDSWCE